MGWLQKINWKKVGLGVATLGYYTMADAAKNQFIDKPLEEAQKANDQIVAKQESLLGEEQKRREDEVSTEKLLQERTQMRARQRMMGTNSAGGSGTLLTGPGGAGATASLGGRKTLLGV